MENRSSGQTGSARHPRNREVLGEVPRGMPGGHLARSEWALMLAVRVQVNPVEAREIHWRRTGYHVSPQRVHERGVTSDLLRLGSEGGGSRAQSRFRVVGHSMRAGYITSELPLTDELRQSTTLSLGRSLCGAFGIVFAEKGIGRLRKEVCELALSPDRDRRMPGGL